MNGHHMMAGGGMMGAGAEAMALMGGPGMHPHLLMGGPASAGQRGKLGRGVTDPGAYAHKLFIGQIPFEVGGSAGRGNGRWNLRVLRGGPGVARAFPAGGACAGRGTC